MKLIPLNAKINCTSANMDLLFNSDKLLKLITLISKQEATIAPLKQSDRWQTATMV